MRAAVLVLASLLVIGCYRIHYVNFSPEAATEPGAVTAPVRVGRGWQHFYLFGWVPRVRTIDARAKCGGAENVDSIQTRWTALQSLATVFTTLLPFPLINVYAPWNGAVYCKERPPR
jgi:hypothetical protein